MQIEHKAVISKIEGAKIWAIISTQSACAHCQAKGACNLEQCQNKEIELYSKNPSQYKIGQEIVVGFANSTAFWALFLGYLLPLIVFLSVFVISKFLNFDEFDCGVFSIISLIPYYLMLNLQKKYLKRKFEIKINE